MVSNERPTRGAVCNMRLSERFQRGSSGRCAVRSSFSIRRPPQWQISSERCYLDFCPLCEMRLAGLICLTFWFGGGPVEQCEVSDGPHGHLALATRAPAKCPQGRLIGVGLPSLLIPPTRPHPIQKLRGLKRAFWLDCLRQRQRLSCEKSWENLREDQ